MNYNAFGQPSHCFRGWKPHESPLWQLLDDVFDEFEKLLRRSFSREYRFFCPVISHNVPKYQYCGVLHQGFSQVCCPTCDHEHLFALCCRVRWFSSAIICANNFIFPVSYQQRIFIIPKIWRRYCIYYYTLLTHLRKLRNFIPLP